MECRKFGDNIGGRGNTAIGELYHTHDHRRGCTYARLWLSGLGVVGLETAGFNNNADINTYAPYTVTDADHSLYTTPHATHLKKGDKFGSSPKGDRTCRHWARMGCARVAISTNDRWCASAGSNFARRILKGIKPCPRILKPIKAADYLTRDTELVDGVAAEFIDWKRPTGGRVINFGSIGVGWAASKRIQFCKPSCAALYACMQTS